MENGSFEASAVSVGCPLMSYPAWWARDSNVAMKASTDTGSQEKFLSLYSARSLDPVSWNALQNASDTVSQ